MKVIIVLTFIVFIFGVSFGYKKDGVVGALFGGVFVPALVFIGLLLLYVGVMFVFS